MKRDWDLIREILFCIEEHDQIRTEEQDWTEERRYNAMQLYEAGLIDGINIDFDNDGNITLYFQPKPRLTWSGHDFLDSIRSDTMWSKTKAKVATVGGAVAFAVLKAVASSCAMQELGLE